MNAMGKPTLIGFLLTATALATPTKVAKHCVDLEIPVPVSASNYQIDAPRVDSNSDAVDWVRNITTWDSPNITERIIGRIPVNDTFSIRGRLCVPVDGKKKDILQIATHGIAFNQQYWDVRVNPEKQSYVDAAIREGYSIFTYDRLGVGQSQKPDAYDIVQAPVEVEILKGLTLLARSGNLVKSAKVLSGNSAACTFKPKKLVHVSHSYGSVVTVGFLELYGQLSDGAIITGFIINDQDMTIGVDSKGLSFAAETDPKGFGDRPSGYLLQASALTTQLLFFSKDSFTQELFDYALQNSDTATTSEFLTTALIVDNVATRFRGPIQFFLAENDFTICAGDCKNTYHRKQVEEMFPVAAHIDIYIQPHTGHGFTFEKNATAGYQVNFSYLDKFDL